MNFFSINLTQSMSEIYFFLPEIYFLFFLIFLFCFNLFFSNSYIFKSPSTLKIGYSFCLFFFLILILFFFFNLKLEIFSLTLFNNQLLFNNFLTFFKFLLTITLFFFFLLSKKYVSVEKFKNYEFILILLFSIFGMFFLISANDFLIFYLALELQSLCLFVLAAYKRFSNFSIEAGLKYFILGGFSSGLLLFGISLIYGTTGLTNFDDLALFFFYFFDLQNKDQNLFFIFLIFIGFFFILISLFFKLGVAPFHSWIVDVYEGAPTIITAYFSIVTKISLILIFFRFIQTFFLFLPISFYQNIFLFCGILSIFIGTFGAILQTKIKRMLAFSTITHVGFIILGFSTLSFNGMFSVLFYLITYIVLSFSIFCSIIALRNWSTNNQLKNIMDLKNLINTNFLIGFVFILTLFSLAGIPPLIGFFSKFFIFLALLEQENYLIVCFALIFSVIGAFYYIRLVKIILFNNNNTRDYTLIFPLIFVEKLILVSSCLINVCFFFNPNIFLNIFLNITKNFFSNFL